MDGFDARGRTRQVAFAGLGISVLAAALAGACGNGGSDVPPAGAGGNGGGGLGGRGSTSGGPSSGPAGGLGFGGSHPRGPYSDFPSTPLLDTPQGGSAPPADAPALFGPPGTGQSGGPCLLEPEIGTLFPDNWVRPRFTWTAANGEDLFELRLTAPNETSGLVVYTTATQWTMPKPMWTALTANIPDVPITVSLRSGKLQNGTLAGPPYQGSSGAVTIAPASAAGSIVYWRTDKANNTGQLKGFSAGDEAVVLALRADQVQVKPGGNTVTCIGCHTSTPDGKSAAFKTLGGTPGGALASIQQNQVGQAPALWSGASIAAMNDGRFGIPSFSGAHWKDGDYTLLASWDNGGAAQIAWFDLQAPGAAQGQAYDFLARNGDPGGAIMPSFSHDGQTVVYTSTSGSTDGRPTSAPTDLYVVPFAARKGGNAVPLAGAADPAYSEYYPALSPDDRLVAFDRIDQGKNTYNQPDAEVFVIPAAGGQPTRLLANDPPACSSPRSPGVTNSWPKWAPEAVTAGDRTFYWIAFSSTRGGALPQLYLTAVVARGAKLVTYPALHIWPQPADEANHTPAWDVFKIPPPPTK